MASTPEANFVNTLSIRYLFVSPQGQPQGFTWFYEPVAASDITMDNIGLIANAAFAAFSPLWIPIADTSQLLIACIATYHNLGTTYEATSTIASAYGTGSDGFPAPDSLALEIKKVTGLTGRTNRGRAFVPCLTATMIAGDVIAPGFIDKCEAIASFFGADQTFATVICHSRHFANKINTLQVIKQCSAIRKFFWRRRRERLVPATPL
jgi:hypothetical protein